MRTVKRSNEQIRTGKGGLDVERLRAATEADIDRWQREDGIADEDLGPARLVQTAPDVRLIRERLGLSQEAFAARFHLSLRTIQEWEQQRRIPEGPARLVLHMIDREPEAAARALASL